MQVEPTEERERREEPATAERQRERRLAYGVALALLAAVFVIGGLTEPAETGERLGRRVELVELIAAEQERTRELEAQVEALSTQVAEHEAIATEGADELAELQAAVDELALPAGHAPVQGPAITVTLDDAIGSWDGRGDPNDYVIHEQDLQAVANALWAGGAEAMAINGQRVLSTSAIRCVGTTLRLNGAYYTPPYEISAIGEPEALVDELDRDPAVTRFRSAAETFGLGFETDTVDLLTVPGHSPGGADTALVEGEA